MGEPTRRIRCFGCHNRFPEDEMMFWDAVGYWLCEKCVMALALEKTHLLSDVVDQLIARFGPHEVMEALIANEVMQALLRNDNVSWCFRHRWHEGEFGAGCTWEETWVVRAEQSLHLRGTNDRARPIG